MTTIYCKRWALGVLLCFFFCIQGNANEPLMIAIAGGSGSGKSTLAKNLFEKLGQRFSKQEVVLMSQDSYMNPAEQLVQFRLPIHPDLPHFDHPSIFNWALMTQQLKEIREGQQVTLPRYYFGERGGYLVLGAGEVVSHPKVVIVDGIHVLYKEIFNLFHFKIFVEAGSQIRFDRRVVRDERERNTSAEMTREIFYAYAEPVFKEFIEPLKNKADLILNGEEDPQKIAQVAFDAIEQHVYVNPPHSWAGERSSINSSLP